MHDLAMAMTHKRKNNLRQSQKLESIGTLAGGVAHDFNNILTVIIGACTLLEMNAGEHPEQMTVVSRIRNYAERAAQLTQNLLAFSRSQTIVMRPEDLTELFLDMRRFLGSIMGEHISLVTEQPERALMVMVDRGQIEQVLMNLAANARDAMPQGGVLSMALSRVRHDGTLAHMDGFPLGEYALITVSDTGTGIDQESLSRIYEPYFTTREAGERTGLGLSVVYGIISQHEGVLQVQSTQGEGTTFRIYLPLCDQEELAMADADDSPVPVGSETILLVDADPVTLSINAGLLERAGYMVLSASDGSEAMELVRHGNGLISLVVVDSELPDMNRLEFWDRDDMKVLVIRGSGGGAVAQGMARKDLASITKPFEPLPFLERVRALIDGEPT